MNANVLKPGDRIRILRTFRDFDGVEFAAGREFVLQAHDVFFYYAGHTFRFADGTVLRLSGDWPENAAILQDRDDVHWKVVPADDPADASRAPG